MTVPAYLLEHSVPHVIKKYVTYSDSGVSAGTLQIGTIPKYSDIKSIRVQIATVSTAGGVLTVGTTSGTANTLVTAGDINETVQAVTSVTGPGVLSANTSAEVPIYVKWATATGGAAYISVEYIPYVAIS